MNELSLRIFEQKIPPILNRCKTPGLSFGIVHKDSLIFSKSFGVNSISQQNGVDQNTLYSVGSITKSMTAFGIVLLAEKNKLSLNVPIVNYFPQLKLYNNLEKVLTFTHLLSHTSGYARDDSMWAFSNKKRKELVFELQKTIPNHGPGEIFQYSNAMYMLAGFLIEQIENCLWENFISENILTPLQMKSSAFTVSSDTNTNQASAHRVEQGTIVEFKEFGFGPCAPAGALISNISDLAKWLSLFLQKDKLGLFQNYFLSCYKKIFTPYVNSSSKTFSRFKEFDQEHYGLGWRIQKYKNLPLFWHSGGTEGFSSFMGILPNSDFGIIILANSLKEDIKTDVVGIVACSLLDIITDHTLEDWDSKFLNTKNEPVF